MRLEKPPAPRKTILTDGWENPIGEPARVAGRPVYFGDFPARIIDGAST